MSPPSSAQEMAFLQNSNDYVSRAILSARNVLPHVFRLVEPKSVLDFGCGGGAWLSVCQELGVTNLLGIDGSYVDTKKLIFDEKYFLAHDLRQPITMAKRFDLAISLEVAEHIPEESSRIYIESLVQFAPVILFSAAIPFQGGVGHVNERWPSYWEELFLERNYYAVDCIRRLVWNNAHVDTWYKQNTMLFVDANFLAANLCPPLCVEHQLSKYLPIDVVHPKRYLEEADPDCIDPQKIPLNTAWKALRLQLGRELRKRMHWRMKRMLKI